MNESKRIVFLDYVRVFACFLGYLVMAHYIREHLDWSTRKKMIAGAVLMTVGAIVTILSFYVQATPGIVISTPVLEIGWNFCTINVACLTAGTFLMFSCIKRSEVPRIITRLSKLSYGMYLMHISGCTYGQWCPSRLSSCTQRRRFRSSRSAHSSAAP